MTTEQRVWIAYMDMGSEGKSSPIRAFETEALARIWKLGSTDTYGSSAKITEMVIIRALDKMES